MSFGSYPNQVIQLLRDIATGIAELVAGGGGGGTTYSTDFGSTDATTLRTTIADDSEDLVALQSLVANQGVSKSTDTATGLSTVRTISANNTAVTIKNAAGNIYGFRVTNKSASVIFVKIYNVAGATPANTPVMTITVPSGDGSWNGDSFDVGRYFNTAISVRCVTGTADNDTTSPATAPIIELDID
jgi:hypothetical protein